MPKKQTKNELLFALNKKGNKFMKYRMQNKGRCMLQYGIKNLKKERVYPFSITVGTRYLAKWMAYMILTEEDLRTHFTKYFFGLKDQKFFTDIIDKVLDMKEIEESSLRDITKKIILLFAEEKIRSFGDGSTEGEIEEFFARG